MEDSDQSVAGSPDSSLGTIIDTQLVEYVNHMITFKTSLTCLLS